MAKLNLIKRNLKWWRSSLSFYEKLSYYPNALTAVVRSLFGDKKIKYLGSEFSYDNKALPLSLMLYPDEISNKILANIDGEITDVLDIGGNLGQFSVTLSHFLKEGAHIDVIEPNKTIFALLEKNTSTINNINVFNVGIGRNSDAILHFEPGRSATGSIRRENAGTQSKLTRTNIKLIDDVTKITDVKSYDLIKIDVEGYEHSLLKHLKLVPAKYMFIEVSGLARYKDYLHSDLFEIIEKKFGSFDILNVTKANIGSNNFDVLLRFEKFHK